MQLRLFQRQFLRALDSGRYDTLALSGPRSLGKSTLAAYILERCLTPGDSLNEPGKEFVLIAASLGQARLPFNILRASLEPKGGYRWLDSEQRLSVTHEASRTKLRLMSSDAKRTLGLVNVPLVILDEGGALDLRAGQMMYDSLTTAQGKVGSPLTLLVFGTLAPMATRAGHWFHDLATGGTAVRRYVQLFQGDRETWDSWQTIRKANPLTAISPEFRAKLLQERDEARVDGRLKARFLSYRLNVPSADESTMLLTVPEWKQVCARDLPERDGRPAVVGVDLGGGRAWSAAVALWENGRCESIAVCPGIPSIEDQERRDRVPAGTYQNLVDAGVLLVADGLHVQPPSQLISAARDRWGAFKTIVCDRFRLADLRDAAKGVKVLPRMARWSEAAEDIRALRKAAKDGTMAADPESQLLLTASLAAAEVKNDDQGNVRLVKQSTNNTGRDDVAAAAVLAAGHMSRQPRRRRGVYLGAA